MARRPWYRLHLLTAIVLMLVAGELLFLNMKPRTGWTTFRDGNQLGQVQGNSTCYGWPFILHAKHATNHQIWTIQVEMIAVNVGPGRGLKLTLGLETQSEELFKTMTGKEKGKELMMQIKNVLYETMGGLQQQDIDSPVKINVLRNNILKGINQMLAHFKIGYVDNVIFLDFIVNDWEMHETFSVLQNSPNKGMEATIPTWRGQTVGLLVDVLIAAAILIFVAFACEWPIRSRERKKQERGN